MRMLKDFIEDSEGEEKIRKDLLKIEKINKIELEMYVSIIRT